MTCNVPGQQAWGHIATWVYGTSSEHLLTMQYADKLDDGKRRRLDEIMTGARSGPAAGAASSGAPAPRQEVWTGSSSWMLEHS